MKVPDFTMAVVADQIASRESSDAVPAALDRLSHVGTILSFERTAGDEIQGLLASPADLVEAIALLTRLGGWRIGIGLGRVDLPLPTSTREARGPAYLAAREAIGAARRRPTALALRVEENVSRPGYAELSEAAEAAETALWLWRGVLSRRSREGWELMDLLEAGHTNTQAARILGVSASAVSQRLAVSGREEGRRGASLSARLLGDVARSWQEMHS